MTIYLALGNKLVAEAKRLGNHRTKRDAVNEAIAEYVACRRRRKILDLFGKMDWDPGYDYKIDR